MPQYQHPGIYVQEIPAARSIQGASTSVAAFIGFTEMGPVGQPTLVTSWSAFTRQFGNPTWGAMTAWAVYEFFAEGGAACYVIRTQDASATAATATVGGLKLTASSPGIWGAALMVVVSNSVGDPGAVPPAPVTPVFTVRIVADAAVIDGPARPDLASQLLTAFVRHNSLPTIVMGAKTYYVLEAFGGVTEATLNSGEFATRVNAGSVFVRVTTPLGGGKAKVARPPNAVVPAPFTGGATAAYDLPDAVSSLSSVQGISLLAVPDTVMITDQAGKVDLGKQTAVINQIMLRCEAMANLFYVVDPPLGLSVQQIQGFTSGTLPGTTAINSSFAAIYYPWVYIFWSLNGLNIPIPPSGPALGRYAETDTRVGVFKSPAGVNDGLLQTVTALDTAVTDSDQDQLNPHGINAVRTFINYGNAIWGARTLSQDTSWTYISVRRLFIFVEQSLRNSLQWVVFEPNDQRLWAAISRDVSAFLYGLWLQGGLFGATTAEAYFVTCDASNNPPETRAQGILYIDIGLAPVYPAEFVVIRITQKTAAPVTGS
ncbi:phage tail protein [Sphingomonas sp. Leaf33]|uniref:phage tail sheath family protein n=1 Tax=Sphingomonas sp. Leaf33 TaxID=1736215 RepID=UPI0006F81F2D|nr:phage tail sheath C-terminal domain-containing protein [Sphingomonas sp. Leaf33]KQN26637.1 phage tail protein [Sphingomonas sp. Leaf33]